MLKKGIILLFLLFITSAANANTVILNLDSNFDVQISSFQVFFDNSDGYGLPIETNWSTFEEDFFYSWGAPQTQKRFWEVASAIIVDKNGTPIDEDDDIDYVTGIGAVANSLNSNLKIKSGTILELESFNTLFKINLIDPKNSFFDFSGTSGEKIEVSLKQEWVGDTQIITITSPVPVPSSLFLLGGGLFALVGITRRKK